MNAGRASPFERVFSIFISNILKLTDAVIVDSVTDRLGLCRAARDTKPFRAPPLSMTESGLHLHKSARYILKWGCDDVSRWLAINNFGQYQVGNGRVRGGEGGGD